MSIVQLIDPYDVGNSYKDQFGANPLADPACRCHGHGYLEDGIYSCGFGPSVLCDCVVNRVAHNYFAFGEGI